MEFAQLNDSNCKTYLVGCPHTKEAALVDPLVSSVDTYLSVLEKGDWKLRFVIDTHTHADHVSGGRLLRERTGADYVMHKKAGSQPSNRRVTDGSSLTLGSLTIEAIDTPGHTKDSVTIKIPGRILTGDWLFIGGAGRTDLPGGDAGEHWDSLSRIIPTLDDTTVIYPGHDYQNHTESSMGDERRNNVNLKPARTREDYVSWLDKLSQPTPEWMIDTVRANNEGVTDPSVNFMPEGAESACMCQPPTASAGLTAISVGELHDLAPAADRLLLDVREPAEFTGELGHVPGATLIPLGQLPARLEEIGDYRNKTVVAICRSGGRSARACGILVDAGFSDVRNMTGGTLAWNEKGYTMER